ncbi:hypothetical protein ACIO93_01730 [Streptomyces sp. NPDC087903]|uniref:hypothetical protein n=1 Tax=Streptomyces sp. NPDC087903 TaxID=3365819 RepID=UPI00380DC4DA
MRFENRVDAGRRPARRLEYLRGADIVVLGLPTAESRWHTKWPTTSVHRWTHSS